LKWYKSTIIFLFFYENYCIQREMANTSDKIWHLVSTSNLSKAHMTRDITGPAFWASIQRAIK